MDAQETICRAISLQHHLEFQCGAETCIVEPHQIGRTPDGDLVCNAYQVAGPPGPGGIVHRWRVYRLAEFNWALESSLPFDGPREGYERAPNGVITSAVCEL